MCFQQCAGGAPVCLKSSTLYGGVAIEVIGALSPILTAAHLASPFGVLSIATSPLLCWMEAEERWSPIPLKHSLAINYVFVVLILCICYFP